MRLTKTAISTLALTTALAACGDNNENNTPDQGPVIIDTDQGVPDMGMNNSDPDMNMERDMGQDMKTSDCEPANILSPETIEEFTARLKSALEVDPETDFCLGEGLNAVTIEAISNKRAPLNTPGISQAIFPEDLDCESVQPTTDLQFDQGFRCLPKKNTDKDIVTDTTTANVFKFNLPYSSSNGATTISRVDLFDPTFSFEDGFTVTVDGSDESVKCQKNDSGARLTCDFGVGFPLESEIIVNATHQIPANTYPSSLEVSLTTYPNEVGFFNDILVNKKVSVNK